MKKAFTLAEVLITLGILGVVMALTLPTLMGEYRKKTIEARLKKFYSASNQAIQQSEVKNGPKEYWARCTNGLQTSSSTTMSCEQWYNLYLKDYLKTIKVEHFDDIYQNTAAYFEDGSLMIVKSGYDIFFYPFAKDFDKDEFFKASNDGSSFSRVGGGTKYFTFSFRPNQLNNYSKVYKSKGIEPYRAQVCNQETQPDGSQKEVCNTLTRDDLLNNSIYGYKSYSHSYCTALIQENNWEIPDDYPLKL